MIFSARKWRVDLDQCDALLASSRRRAAAGSGAGTGLICCDGVVADYAEDAHVVQAALRRPRARCKNMQCANYR